MKTPSLTRRAMLRVTAGGLSGLGIGLRSQGAAFQQKLAEPKAVTAILTEYRKLSHADVIVSRLLNGWRNEGGPGPNLKLVSLYIDQPDRSAMGLQIAKEFGIPVMKTIEEAMTLGGKDLAVEGVFSVGEHGDYPYNEKGQHLYPRRRFFEGIVETFEKCGRVVPVFNDKHPGPVWDDTAWIYKTARSLQIPFMAGSSIPVAFRNPDPVVPMNAPITAAVGVGYGGLDAYGFHGLEGYQALVERRRGAEYGVDTVQCLSGDAMRDALSNGTVDQELLNAALGPVAPGGIEQFRGYDNTNVALFLFTYRDKFQGAVVQLPGYAQGISVGLRLEGAEDPVVTRYEERPVPHYPHFAYLTHAVEQMITTGKPTYPVERTILTAGILDRALTSRSEGGKKRDTPELAISYTPVDYPHAPEPLGIS